MSLRIEPGLLTSIMSGKFGANNPFRTKGDKSYLRYDEINVGLDGNVKFFFRGKKVATLGVGPVPRTGSINISGLKGKVTITII